MTGASEKEIDVALEEYRAMWAYYVVTLNERERLFSNYLKIVALPSGLLLAIASASRSDKGGFTSAVLGPNSWIAGSVLLVLFLVGVSSFLAYAFETRNSRKYLDAVNKLRSGFRKWCPNIKDHLIMAQSERDRVSRRLGRVALYRGQMVSLLNTGVLISGIFLICPESSAEALLYLFIACAALQLLIYREIALD